MELEIEGIKICKEKPKQEVKGCLLLKTCYKGLCRRNLSLLLQQVLWKAEKKIAQKRFQKETLFKSKGCFFWTQLPCINSFFLFCLYPYKSRVNIRINAPHTPEQKNSMLTVLFFRTAQSILLSRFWINSLLKKISLG